MRNLQGSLAISAFRVAAIFLVLTLSCTQVKYTSPVEDTDLCEVFDSLYYASFLHPDFSLEGKARIDVKQYRLRGRFTLSVSRREKETGARGFPPATGETSEVFNFVSSSYFGAQRENLTVSMSPGGLNVFDRERGEYYQGKGAERLACDVTNIRGDIRRLVDMILGEAPDCKTFMGLKFKDDSETVVFKGRVDIGDFRFIFSWPDGKLMEINWPVEMRDGSTEILRVVYRWGGGGNLEGIRIAFQKRKWQVKLNVAGITEGERVP